MARAVMLQGTGSDVGKTVLVAGLCRAARRRGLKVRPFKPQNMSNNAAVAAIPGEEAEGEIGRAQWLQALACGVAPTVHMNPVLLKPQSDIGAQVVVQGRVHCEARARDYGALKKHLLSAVMDSWEKVGEGADLVIVEGAGSPAEINLRDRDIANMGFATRADVPVILVGDIDRGGVIAALAGTHLILPEEDRAMVEGFIINKFRGDLSLFDEGLAAITRFTGWRPFGIVPWLAEAARLPSEDSVVLERLRAGDAPGLKVAVPMLSRIANFDDLDPLRAEPGVEVVFVPPGRRLPEDGSLVIVPGTKSTIADLAFLRRNGWDRDIAAHRARGGAVVGLCGGYQMLGRRVLDPQGIEGNQREADGLGFLDVETVMAPEKAVRNVEARSARYPVPLSGYEIHLGETTGPDCGRPVAFIGDRPDGAMSPDGRVFGTYLHGLFGADAFRRAFLAEFGVRSTGGYREQVEAALDAIAGDLERHLDCDGIFAAAR
ncbi:cobyric acid synthase [Chelativorans sp. AA-79]|uniref:cobyric acid synthase n=1 Tax=Chelativorans sp. AA-79 TaxID=3028735 RepID=UPI0023F64BE2|nr:cobyric acid synthase [Chelativorans sp. AA-79]WEX11438.1 cobyric acid synthase [Chelativorans sp. AA-79]